MTNTGFLTALYVIATPFVSYAILGRTVAAPVWAGVVLAFLGMWSLGGGSLEGFGSGDALVASAAVFWASQILLTEAASPLDRPVLFTTVQFLVVGALSSCAAVLLEPASAAGLSAAAVEILYVGVLSSALTFTVLALALRATSAVEAAVIVSTDTVFAALGAWLLLGERLSGLGMVGAGLILTAVLVVRLAPVRG